MKNMARVDAETLSNEQKRTGTVCGSFIDFAIQSQAETFCMPTLNETVDSLKLQCLPFTFQQISKSLVSHISQTGLTIASLFQRNCDL